MTSFFTTDLTNLSLNWKQLQNDSYSQFVKVLDHVASYENEDNSGPRFTEKYDEKLNKLCAALSDCLSQLQKEVNSMREIQHRFQKCEDLQRAQFELQHEKFGISAELLNKSILFYSWEINQFVESCYKILKAYEVQVTNFIVIQVATTAN